MDYYSAIKSRKSTCNNTNKDMMLREISQKERRKYPISLLCGILKTELRELTDTEDAPMVAGGRE